MAWVHTFYFVAAEGSHIRRNFHVQFEGYLPGNDHTYHYASPDHYTLGDHVYLYDVQVGDYYHYIREHPDTDAAQGYALFAAKGYDITRMTNIIRERYVRVLDEARRNEILFIYAEDLTPTGLTEREWEQQDPRFEQVLVNLHRRAEQAFHVIEG